MPAPGFATFELNEGTAARRSVPVQLVQSNGTTPDPNRSNSSCIIALNSGVTFTPNAKLSATHAAQGMYLLQLNQSDLSVLGTHGLYCSQGSFAQFLVAFEVVNYNPFSSFSNIGAKAYSGVTVEVNNAAGDMSSVFTVGVGAIKAVTYSGVTVGVGDYAAKNMTSLLTVSTNQPLRRVII